MKARVSRHVIMARLGVRSRFRRVLDGAVSEERILEISRAKTIGGIRQRKRGKPQAYNRPVGGRIRNTPKSANQAAGCCRVNRGACANRRSVRNARPLATAQETVFGNRCRTQPFYAILVTGVPAPPIMAGPANHPRKIIQTNGFMH